MSSVKLHYIDDIQTISLKLLIGFTVEGWRGEGALDDHLLRPGILFRADRGSPDCEGGGEAEDWRQQEPDSSLNIMGGKIIFIILSFNL